MKLVFRIGSLSLGLALAVAPAAWAQSDCVVQYRLLCPPQNIHAGDEVTLTLQMRATGTRQTTLHALTAVITTTDDLASLGAATIRETIVPPDSFVPLADIVPENRVYTLANRKQVLTFSVFLQLIGDLRITRGVWINVADIPVAVSLDHPVGATLTLCLEDVIDFQGFAGENDRRNEVVIDCADNPTRPLAAIAVDTTRQRCYTCTVDEPLFQVNLKRLIKSCRLNESGCADPAPGVPCVDLVWCIRDWKGFVNNTNPKGELELRRSTWLCAGTKNGDNCDNHNGQECLVEACPTFACRKCVNPCTLRSSLTIQEINDISVARQGDSCYAERFRPPARQAAEDIAEEEFCLRADVACGTGRLRFAAHDDAIRSFCTSQGTFDVEFALASTGVPGVEDMYFWIRDCDTVELPYDACGQVGLCYEIGFEERTNDDRKPFRRLFTPSEQIILRRLQVDQIQVGGSADDPRTSPDSNWLNYYMDIHDVAPVEVRGGELVNFFVHGSGFGPGTRIGICVKGVKLVEPCCCDDDNTSTNRAGTANELNWTYLFDGGEQCVYGSGGTRLVRRSTTTLRDCNTVAVFVEAGEGLLPLLAARPPCVGVFDVKLFVYDVQNEQCIRPRLENEYHCPLELALPRPTPGNACGGRAQQSIFCASAPIDLHYGFSRPDFDYARSGIDSFELYDVFAILFFLFGQFERPFNEPLCRDAADVNDNGRLDLGDPVTALHQLFNMGFRASPPAWPELGNDQTNVDELNCAFTADDARAIDADCFGCTP